MKNNFLHDLLMLDSISFFKNTRKTNNNKQRIFIVGCPRSGTTLLQSLLSAHSQLASFPESKFFFNMVNLPVEKSRRYKLGIVSKKSKPSLDDFFQTIDRPDLIETLPKLPLIKPHIDRFISILDTLTYEQGKKIWIEKTPEHLHNIECIEKFVDNPKIIHIVRDGCDVIASLYDLAKKNPETWGYYTNWDLDKYINKWIQEIEITKRHLDKSNHTVVLYEKLVDNPQIILENLCNFIGVDFESQMIEKYGDSAASLIRDRETWKANNMKTIQKLSSKKFERVFDEKQRNYIQEKLSCVDLDLLLQ